MSRNSSTLLAALVLATTLAACGEKKPQVPGQHAMATGDVQRAALATYVKPGDLDSYYLFYSGGHSGQVFVAGVPSMRHIATIPVFTPYPGTGYGFDGDGWKHGKYQGELEVQGRVWDLSTDEGRSAMFGIVDAVARFEVDGQVGWGLFEHLFI